MLRQEQLDQVLAAALLLLLATAAAAASVRAARRWRLAAAALTAVAVAAWLHVDRFVEGRVLLEVTRGHGVATADLLVLPAVALVLLGALRARRR